MTGPVNPKTGFSYDLPTENDDDSPLNRADIAKFQIGVGTVSGQYDFIVDDLTIEAVKQLSPISLLGKLSYGQKYSAIRTVTTPAAGGKTSKWSTPEVLFVLEAPTPNPPSNFGIA